MNNRFILIITGLLVLNLRVSSQSDDYYYKIGLELLNSYNYQGAIFYFDKAIALNPDISIYYDNRAYAKSMIEELDGAILDYEKAINLVPDEPLYFYLIGNIFSLKGDTIKAITNYTQAIELDSTDYIYYFNRGNLYLKIEAYLNAIQDYNSTVKINPENYGALNNRAIAYYKLGNKTEACSDWNLAQKNGIEESSKQFKRYCLNSISDTATDFGIILKTNDLRENVSPSFNIKGSTDLRDFIQSNLRYPKEAYDKDEFGVVMVKFYIMENGSLDSFSIVNSASKLLDEEAIRVIKLSDGYWNPGKISGKPKAIAFIMPVEFRIQGLSKPTVSNNITNNSSNSTEFKYVTVYYDSIWQVTTPSKASYYRFAQWNPYNYCYHGKYTDYTINNIKIGEGEYFDNMKNDTLILYYPSGQISCIGYYINNIPDGIWYYYYEDGDLKQKVVFTKGTFYIETLKNEFDSLLICNGTGKWQMKMLDGLKKSEIIYQGEFKNYKKHGPWSMIFDSKKIVEEYYRNGNFIKGSMLDETNKIVPLSQGTLNSWMFHPIHLICSEQLMFDSTTTNGDYTFRIKSQH